MIGRDLWGARDPKSRTALSLPSVKSFIVHHTTGQHLGRDDSASWVRAIQDFHMDTRGWSDIGYNFIVDQHGEVFEGRGWGFSGAHAAGMNSRSFGVAFLGSGNGEVPAAALEAIAELYEEACGRCGRELQRLGHRDVSNTACPGDGLYRWVRGGDWGAPSGTPIVTSADSVTLEVATAWAKSKGAAPWFLAYIIPALYRAAKTLRAANGGQGVDAALAVVQAAKETGYGRFGGVLDKTFHNTAGIKTAKGGGNFDPDAHQRFDSWDEGARAHLNHLAAYTGLRPVGTPHGRYFTVLALSWAGSVQTVEGLGARWAPNPKYGQDLVRMLAELAATAPALPVAPADRVLSLGDAGEDVRQVQSWLLLDGQYDVRLYTSVKRFQHRHGLKVDGIIGPKTWAKLREVYG